MEVCRRFQILALLFFRHFSVLVPNMASKDEEFRFSLDSTFQTMSLGVSSPLISQPSLFPQTIEVNQTILDESNGW